MGFIKTLLLDELELEVRGDNVKEDSRIIRGHYYCKKCNDRIKKANFCEKCNSIVDVNKKLINSEGEEINEEEFKMNLSNPKDIVCFKPIDSDKSDIVRINRIYVLSPSNDSEGFNLLFNSLMLQNKTIPIKFRYNSNSFEEKGYIAVEKGYMLLKLVSNESVSKNFEKYDSTEVDSDTLKYMETIYNKLKDISNEKSYLEELKLIKERKERKKAKKLSLLEQIKKQKQNSKVKVKPKEEKVVA